MIDNVETYDKTIIAQKLTPANKRYTSYLSKNNSHLTNAPLTDKEFECAFSTLKHRCTIKANKSAGYDDISASANINVFDSIKKNIKIYF